MLWANVVGPACWMRMAMGCAMIWTNVLASQMNAACVTGQGPCMNVAVAGCRLAIAIAMDAWWMPWGCAVVDVGRTTTTMGFAMNSRVAVMIMWFVIMAGPTRSRPLGGSVGLQRVSVMCHEKVP